MPNTYILRNVPEQVWRPFKATCAMNGHSMRAVLYALMSGYSAGELAPTVAEKPQRQAAERITP